MQLFFRFGSDNSFEEINTHICIYLRCEAWTSTQALFGHGFVAIIMARRKASGYHKKKGSLMWVWGRRRTRKSCCSCSSYPSPSVLWSLSLFRSDVNLEECDEGRYYMCTGRNSAKEKPRTLGMTDTCPPCNKAGIFRF